MCKIENVKGWARQCSFCGAGMNEGFVDDGSYYCDQDCLIMANRRTNPTYSTADWKEDHERNPNECYYTAWEDKSDIQFIETSKGVILSIEDFAMAGEFMGLKWDLSKLRFINSKNEEVFRFYLESWDDLLPLYYKVTEDVSPLLDGLDIEEAESIGDMTHALLDDNKAMVFNHAIVAITWYNKNK